MFTSSTFGSFITPVQGPGNVSTISGNNACHCHSRDTIRALMERTFIKRRPVCTSKPFPTHLPAFDRIAGSRISRPKRSTWKLHSLFNYSSTLDTNWSMVGFLAGNLALSVAGLSLVAIIAQAAHAHEHAHRDLFKA